MPQIAKRSLRERRVPRNFDSDNQDLNSDGYIKNTYPREMRNPSLQLNADAKIFIKFINSVNKNYREYQENEERQQVKNVKQNFNSSERKQKYSEISSSQGKRQFDFYREGKIENSKKIKQPFSCKAQIYFDGTKIQRNDSFLSRIKNMTLQSAEAMRHLEMNFGKDKPLINSKNQLVNPEIASKLVKSFEQSFKKKSKDVANGVNGSIIKKEIAKNAFFVRDNQKMAKINEIEEKLGIPKNCFNDSKLFKRSSYHVAISYFIYFKKLRQKGPIGEDADPTLHAKRLKEQMTRSA